MKKLDPKTKERLIKEFGHIPTKEEIFEKLIQSQERMIKALAGASRTAPHDPQIRAQILKAMEKAVKLREKIYKSFGKKPPRLKIETDSTLEVDEDMIS